MGSSRQGWVAGDIVASESDPGRGNWLTVWGSYYTRPVLHSTAADARADTQRGESVAHVTEVGRSAFRITAGTLADRIAPPEPCALDECDCHTV